jgi:NTP pyrophosphatase (non-canonical NTP hydrolase)
MNEGVNLSDLIPMLLNFRKERNWEQFHRPKELTAAISIEASELQDIFLWMNDNEIKTDITENCFRKKIVEEVADILIYLLYFSLD